MPPTETTRLPGRGQGTGQAPKAVASEAEKTTKAIASEADKTTKPNSAPAGSDVPPVMNRRHRLLEKLRESNRPRNRREGRETEPHQGAPIYITRGDNGKLVITSRDTAGARPARGNGRPHRAAPERLRGLLPEARRLHLGEVRTSTISSRPKRKRPANDRARRWWWDDDSSNKKDDSPKLSRRKPMRFIVDRQTNSILVQGGTADQLRQIEELINMYDNPKNTSTRPARVTQIFHIQHSKASVIADVIKDTYRDLLSTKDKALESYNQTKAQGKSGGRGYISYDFGEKEDDGKMSKSRFSGALSMGIDDTTNTLLVSCATQNMMLNIQQIIERLDKAAVPAAQSLTVLQINRSIDANNLTKKLGDLLKKPTATQTPGQQPGQNQPQQQQGRRGGRGGNRGGNDGGGGDGE